jgi:thiol peroxidase
MRLSQSALCFIIILILVVFSCAGGVVKPTIETASSEPGGTITRGETTLHLIGNPIRIGDSLPSVSLVDAENMKDMDLSIVKGNVLLLSIVPSLDTKVCEAQTHYLGEKGDRLPAGVKKIVISRDTPFAQKRFAHEAKLADLSYLSDYKEADFGRATGLLIEELRLLARSVMVADKLGVVRYIQVVPEITHLPDMEKAFAVAIELNAEN